MLLLRRKSKLTSCVLQCAFLTWFGASMKTTVGGVEEWRNLQWRAGKRGPLDELEYDKSDLHV